MSLWPHLLVLATALMGPSFFFPPLVLVWTDVVTGKYLCCNWKRVHICSHTFMYCIFIHRFRRPEHDCQEFFLMQSNYKTPNLSKKTIIFCQKKMVRLQSLALEARLLLLQLEQSSSWPSGMRQQPMEVTETASGGSFKS